MTLDEAAREFETEVAVGERPSLRQIQTRCHTGRPRAQQIQTHLVAIMGARGIASVSASKPGVSASTVRVREPVEVMELV
jgi:hypothetical protein